MPAPTNVVANCPPGLEYLTQIDQIRIHQQIELFQSIIISFVYNIKTDVICKYIFQVFTGYEADKKYRLGEEGAQPKRIRFKALKA